MKIIEWLLSSLVWLLIFIAPAITGAIFGVIIWLHSRDAWSLRAAILIVLTGCGVGVAFAEKARRDKGSIEFMARNIAHPELRKKENK
ncbi:hypothetical protein ACFST9_06595 [Hymenobacter monticola]|uniref:Uncharacterized protein n=1 Tax=Hymenobacter monticola TaxID=1705399 RepID=A0ABY4BBY5_9BACT|nr:hypothetical protein [Hymenobacter monticola]UOE36284.1 hypothetical protein MTP16_11715 [Hymenobacter monticola]